jgi:hypothetical protein
MSRHQQKQEGLWSLADNNEGSSTSDDPFDPSWLVRIRNLNRRNPDVRPSDSNAGRAVSHRFVQARIVRRATSSYIKKRQSQRSQRRMRLPANDFFNLSFPEYRDLTSTQAESPAQDSPPLPPIRSTHPRPTDSPSPSSFLQKLMQKSLLDDAERQDSLPFDFSIAASDNVGKTIQISSGVHVPLRGLEETRECIVRDFYLPLTCLGCSVDVCCIQDANYVICPVCQVVSPLGGNADNDHGKGGVGLGFTF